MDTPQHDQHWEERFRQSIEAAESEPLAEAWDTPSDAVWAGVSEALEHKKRRRLLLFWWWGAGAALLLLVGGFALWQSQKTETETPNPQAGNTIVNDRNQQAETTPSNEAQTPCPPVETIEVIQVPEVQNSHQVTTPSKANSTNFKTAKTHISPVTPSNMDGVAAVATEQHMQSDIAELAVLFSDLPTLPTASVESAESPANTVFSKTPIDPARSKMQWWLGVYGGPMYTISSVRAEQPGSLFFRKQETAEWSWTRGLQLKMLSPSGWYAQLGVGTYSIRQSASQVFRLRFDPMQERQLPSGEWESTFALSVPSSYGETEAEIDLRRDDANPLQEGQIVVVEAQSTQALQYFNYSLRGGFVKSSGRWSYGAGAGFGLNVLQDRSFSLRLRSRQAGIRLPEARIRRAFNDASDNTTDLQLSAMLGYRLTSRWMIALEPTLRHNLSPLARNSTFSTAATTAGLQLSLNFNIH